jgi:surface carbohydrate biosynthesis protein (TIGR04326 family)
MRNFTNVLVIFDEDIDISSLHKELLKSSPKNIDLYPLTSNWRLISEIKSTTRGLFNTDIEIKLMESAEAIDKEIDAIRERVTKWSADFGDSRIAGKSLKEWFLVPKGEVSTWWFSLLSEKNSIKTNVFLRLAQLQAIDKIISLNSFDSCLVSVSEKILLLSIRKICQRYSTNMLPVASLKRKKTLQEKIKAFLNKQNTLSFTLKALSQFFLRLSRAIQAKLVMGSRINRIRIDKNSILFISYFPAVDIKSAEKGTLKNKYALPLQKKLSEMDKKIIWIWMYAFIDGHNYSDALALAKKFKKNGEANFFLEEFISFNVFIRVLFLWLRQFLIFIKLRRSIPTQLLYKNLSIPDGSAFIKNLVARSFIGWTGLEGLLFFELFKELFTDFPNPSHCIYYLEMQAWEKALNAAKQLKSPRIKSIGFQHSSIFRNFFPYFHHPSEMIQADKSMFLPSPNVFACNGDIPMHIISRCRYPNLTKVEAIRHLYLADYLGNLDCYKKQNIVLIAGSTYEQETRALISLFYEAFPKPNGFEVWLKGHPAFPFEKILKSLRIDIKNCSYTIKQDPVNELLKPVKILIVGGSTAAVEGLATGCRIITPICSDNIFMSPLKGFEEFYTKVHNPKELRTAIEQTLQHNEKKQNFSMIKNFIPKYLCLDPSLNRWEKLLSTN